VSAGDVVLIIGAIGAQLAVLIPLYLQGRATKATVNTVQVQTNGQHTVAMNRIDQLEKSITGSGGTVPDVPTVPAANTSTLT
jgi:hypothetical protein